MRVKTSRPRSSVPKKCASDGGALRDLSIDSLGKEDDTHATAPDGVDQAEGAAAHIFGIFADELLGYGRDDGLGDAVDVEGVVGQQFFHFAASLCIHRVLGEILRSCLGGKVREFVEELSDFGPHLAVIVQRFSFGWVFRRDR